MKTHKPKTIEEAVKDLRIFLLVDLYTKFKPEEKVGNEIWVREDYFKSFTEFTDYIEEHFEVLLDQIRELKNDTK